MKKGVEGLAYIRQEIDDVNKQINEAKQKYDLDCGTTSILGKTS